MEVSKPALSGARHTKWQMLATFLNLPQEMAEPGPPSPPPPRKADEQAFNQPPLLEASPTTVRSQSDAVLSERTDANLNTTATATVKRFSCFLSHYKHEAGTEARLVKDRLAPLIKKDSFLDSGKTCLV